MMEQFIKDNLQDGEKIVWTGRPQKVKLWQDPFKSGLMTQWLFSLAIILFCIWYWFSSIDKGIPYDRVRNIVMFFSAVSIFIAISPFFSIQSLKKKCLYCVTNQRAIICQNADPMKMRIRVLADVDDISYDTLDTGCGTIYIGEKTKRSVKMARGLSMNPHIDDSELSLVFHSIEDPDTICEYLKNGQKNRDMSEESAS